MPTADQRLDQLEPIISELLARQDETAAKVERVSAQVRQLTIITTTSLATQSDNIEFLLNKTTKLEQSQNEFRLEMNQRFEQIDQRFERMDQRFERMDQRFERMDQRFEQIDQRFERIDQRFEQIDHQFKQMNQRFEQIDQRFERMDQRFEQLFDFLKDKLK